MSTAPYRRIVTGLDANGRSCVLIDGPPQPLAGMGSESGMVWQTSTIPVDNSARDDAAAGAAFGPRLMHAGGSGFAIVEVPAGTEPFMHATDTIDYIVMLKGRVTLVLETGEVALAPGDFVVDRGVLHAWRNDGAEPAVFVVVYLPAHPVGAGRTV